MTNESNEIKRFKIDCTIYISADSEGEARLEVESIGYYDNTAVTFGKVEEIFYTD